MKLSSTTAQWWEMVAARGKAPRSGKAESSLPSARFSNRGSGGRRKAARSLRKPQKVGVNTVYSKSLSSLILSHSPFHQHSPLFSYPPPYTSVSTVQQHNRSLRKTSCWPRSYEFQYLYSGADNRIKRERNINSAYWWQNWRERCRRGAHGRSL